MKSTVVPMLSLAALIAASSATAETYYLKASDESNSGSTSFNSAGNWSSGKAPAKGNDYIADGFAIRTPNQSNAYTFAGDSLTLRSDISEATVSWGGLTCKHKGGESKPVTINNLILENGRCSISDTYSSSSNPEKVIAGNITIDAGFFGFFGTSETGDRRMIVKSALHGAGSIVFELKESQSQVTFAGTNTNFSGRLYLDHDGVHNTANGGGNVIFRSPESWPAAPAELDPQGVVVNNGGRVSFDFGIDGGTLLTGAARGLTINTKAATVNVADACTVTIEGPISSEKGLVKGEAGTLVLAGDNANLTSAATLTVNAGTLKLASSTAVGSASLTIAEGAVLAVDPSAGAIRLAAKPTGLATLVIEAETVADPKAIDLFSYPTPDSGDLVLEAIQVTTRLPESVNVEKMKLQATADPETGRTTVSYILPSSDVPTIKAELTALLATTAEYTVTVGYVDEELTDEMSLTACYGTTDGGKDVGYWENSQTTTKVPGSHVISIPLAAEEIVVAFRAQKGDGEVVWTAPMSVAAPVVSLVADGTTLVEGAEDGVTLTLTRPAASAELPLTVGLSYEGHTAVFGEGLLPTTVTFPAGETSVTVQLKPTDDDELSEEGTLTVSLAISATSSYVVSGDAGSASVRILDDESLKRAVCLVEDLSDLPEGASDRGRCVTTLDEAFLLVNYTAEKSVYVYPETVSLAGNVDVPQRVAVVGVPTADGSLPLLDMAADCVMTIAERASLSSLRIVSQRTTGTPITAKAGATVTGVTFADWIAGATNAGFKNVLEMNGANVKLTNCSFVNCKSSNGYGIVYCSGAGEKVIEDCSFFQCRVNGDKAGGTIYTENNYVAVNLLIDRVRIEECYARAGVLRQDSGDVRVRHCFFRGNEGGAGWMLMIVNNAWTLEVVQTTIVDSIGKAITLGKKSKGTITNSLFWNNSTEDIQIGETASAVIKNTRYREAVEGDGNGNIAADPRLKPNYMLMSQSPCIDAGQPLSWTADDLDLAGNPRVKGAGVDMGCFEYFPAGLVVVVR